MDNNKLEYIVNELKTKGKLTKDYLISFGKVFIQNEYEDMGIKFNFNDKKYNK